MKIRIPILKTITYRVLGSIASYSIAYFVTGSIQMGMTVALTDFLIKPLLYFLHELFWDKIQKEPKIYKGKI
jgi:uncharacterized membrane protein